MRAVSKRWRNSLLSISWVVHSSVTGHTSGAEAHQDDSAAATAETYRELLARAEVALGMGEIVVLDASWSDRAQRDLARAVAHRTHAEVVELGIDVVGHTVVRHQHALGNSCRSRREENVCGGAGVHNGHRASRRRLLQQVAHRNRGNPSVRRAGDLCF